MLWNGVSRIPRFSAYRCMNRSRSGSAAAAASAPLRGGVGRKRYSTRQPSRDRVPRQSVALDDGVDALGEPLRQLDHPLEGLLREDLLERCSRRSQREHVAGQRAADAADVGERRVHVRSIRSATSAVKPYAAAGIPPAMVFPIVTRSGSSPCSPV